MSIYRWAKLDDQSGPDRSIELTSISGWAGKKPSQEGLVFGSVARLPLVGPEHQWVGRKKTIPGRVGAWECGAPPVGRPRTSVGRPAETQSNLEHTHRKENTRAEHTGREQQHFRLIDHWKREPVSGSLCIGIKFRFQAHSTIGKCFVKPKVRRKGVLAASALLY